MIVRFLADAGIPEMVETATAVKGISGIGAIVFLLVAMLLVKRKLPKAKGLSEHEQTKQRLVESFDKSLDAMRDIAIEAIRQGKTTPSTDTTSKPSLPPEVKP